MSKIASLQVSLYAYSFDLCKYRGACEFASHGSHTQAGGSLPGERFAGVVVPSMALTYLGTSPAELRDILVGVRTGLEHEARRVTSACCMQHVQGSRPCQPAAAWMEGMRMRPCEVTLVLTSLGAALPMVCAGQGDSLGDLPIRQAHLGQRSVPHQAI